MFWSSRVSIEIGLQFIEFNWCWQRTRQGGMMRRICLMELFQLFWTHFFYEVIIAGWEQCISSLGAEFYIWNTNVWSCSQKCFRLDEISTRIQMERADQKFWCAVVITPWEMFWCPCMLVKRGPLEKHTDHIATMFEKPWSIDKRRQYVWAWVLVRD